MKKYIKSIIISLVTFIAIQQSIFGQVTFTYDVKGNQVSRTSSNTRPTAAIAATGATTFCAGDSVKLTAAGGTTYNWSNGQTTPSVFAAASGTYAVTVTTASGCAATASKNVVVNAKPTPIITGTLSVCAGSSTTLTASGGTAYRWSNNANTANVTITESGTYTVTVTNDNGCTASLSKVVTVNPPVNARIDGSTSICQGSSTTLTGVGGVSYKWSTGANTPTLSVSQSGTYNVTVTDANGCTATASKTVTIGSALTPTITGNTTFCSGSNTTLTTSGGTSYLWSNGATTPTVTVNSAGTYTVTVTNADGCTGTTSKVVTVNPSPNLVVSGNTSFCTGSNTTLVASGGTSYVWSNGLTTPSVTIAQSGSYSVTATDANGCAASQSRSITVNPLPNPVISGDTTVCSGGSTTLTASGGTSYVWSTGANTPSINIRQAGTYTVTVTNAQGCSATTSKILNLNAPVQATITGDSAFCSGNSTVLTATGGATYLWSNGTTGASITVTQAGNYSVTATNSKGCSAVVTRTVTLSSQPNAQITVSGLPTFCEGKSLKLNASGGSTYRWSTGETTPSITVAQGGAFTVTVSTGQGCSKSATQNVIMSPKPTARFTIGNIVGGQVPFTNTTVGGSYYFWTFGDGKTSTDNNPANIYTANGTYTVTLIAFSSNGCTDTTKIPITITRVATNDLPEGMKIHVSPNPFSNSIRIQLETNLAVSTLQSHEILVQDVLGRIVKRSKIDNLDMYLDTFDWVEGVYLINIRMGTQSYAVGKLVKMKN